MKPTKLFHQFGKEKRQGVGAYGGGRIAYEKHRNDDPAIKFWVHSVWFKISFFKNTKKKPIYFRFNKKFYKFGKTLHHD